MSGTVDAYRSSPYVGLRPFNADEQHYFFGRDEEIQILEAQVMSQRASLFYAQSGAGKSSLLHAGLAPELTRVRELGRGAHKQAYQKMRVLAVVTPGAGQGPGAPAPAPNLIVANLLSKLLPAATADDLARMTLGDGLATLLAGSPLGASGADAGAGDLSSLLILDQFEELFTHYPERSRERADFFYQAAAALEQHPDLHLLLTMREDYIAELTPYAHLLPDHLRQQFRMERLKREAALLAVTEPAKRGGRSYAPGVAEELVDNLRRVQSAAPGGGSLLGADMAATLPSTNGETPAAAAPLGDYVEPIHLQIVCKQLWEKLPPERTVIEAADLQAFGDVDQVLSSFYEAVVEQVDAALVVTPRRLRSWFDRELITPARTRKLVYRGEQETEGLPNAAVDILVREYIIRAEPRGGAIYYELAHDRLVEPILAANERWFGQYQRPLELAARQWAADKRDDKLWDDVRAENAKTLMDADPDSYTDLEKEFVWASLDRLQRRTEARRRWVLTGAVSLALLFLILTVWSLLNQRSASLNYVQAERNRLVAVAAQEAAEVQAARALAASSAAEVAAREAEAYARELALAQASTQRRSASVGLAAVAQDLLSRDVYDPSLALLLAVQATTITLEAEGTVEPVVEQYLRRAVEDAGQLGWRTNLPPRRHTDEIYSVEFTHDGQAILSASADQTARLWEAATGRELLSLTGHAGPVWAAHFSPDGTLIATTGQDGTIRFWDPQTGAQLRQIAAHTDRTRTLAFSPDGSRIVTASQDGTAKVWDVASGEKLLEFTHGDVWMLAAAYSLDGHVIATTGADNTARLWDATSGEPLHTLPHEKWVRNAAFHPDGQRLVTVSADGTVRVWDVQSGAALKPFAPHTFDSRVRDVNAIVFSPDGRRAATVAVHGQIYLRDGDTGAIEHAIIGHDIRDDTVLAAAFSPDGTQLVTGGEDQTLRLWDAETGSPLAGAEQRIIGGHTNSVRTADFNPDGTVLATAGSDGTAIFWDVATGERLRSVQAHTDTIRSLAFSPAGDLLVTGGAGGAVRVWDVQSGAAITTLLGFTETVMSVRFRPDGQRIVAAGDPAHVRVWDVATGAQVVSLTGHTDTVRVAVYSPDGLTLLTGSEDGSARLWNAETGAEQRRVRRAESILAAAFSPDGRLIAIGSRAQGAPGTAVVWDTTTRQIVNTLTGHAAAVEWITFTPNGRGLLTASGDTSVRLWEASTGRQVGRLLGHTDAVYAAVVAPSGRTIATVSADRTVKLWEPPGEAADGSPLGAVLTGHNGIVRYVAFSPDDRRLVSAGEDREPRVWEVATGNELLRLVGHTEAVWSAEFNPAGDTILTAGQDGTIRLWDAATGRETMTRTLGTQGVNDATYSPDGTLIVTAGSDRTLRLWEAATLTVTRVMTGHSQPVLAATFSPDGRLLASSSADGTARVWDAQSGEEVRRFRGHNDWVWFVTFSPDGQQVATAGGDGTARVWSMATGQLLLTLSGHVGLVRSVQYSPDGGTLLTAGEDRTLRLWDARAQGAPAFGRGRELRQLSGHRREVWFGGFSHDGERIVSASFDGTVRLWDAHIEDTIARARALIQRDPPIFTQAERDLYLYGLDD